MGESKQSQILLKCVLVLKFFQLLYIIEIYAQVKKKVSSFVFFGNRLHASTLYFTLAANDRQRTYTMLYYRFVKTQKKKCQVL